jgi:hypothetical protein
LERRKDVKKFGAEGEVGAGDGKEWDWAWADGGKVSIEKGRCEGIKVSSELAGYR